MTLRFDNYFPTSVREWASDMADAGSAATDFAHGAVVDNAVELFHFLPDVTRYVLGVDAALGAGREKTMGQVARGVWRTYNDWGDEAKNPLTGPITRTADVICGVVYGTVDLLTGHAANAIFNDHLGFGIKYFTPPPTDARGMGRDVGMAALIFATPAIKTRGYQALGIEPQPSRHPEPLVFRAKDPPEILRLSPAPFVFMIGPGLIEAIRYVKQRVRALRKASSIERRQTINELRGANVSLLEERARTNRAAFRALVDLSRLENHEAAVALQRLAQAGFDPALEALAGGARGDVVQLSLLRDLAEDGRAGALEHVVRVVEDVPSHAYILDELLASKNPRIREQARHALQTLDVRRAVAEALQADASVPFPPAEILFLGHLAELGNSWALTALVDMAMSGNEHALRSVGDVAARGSQVATMALGNLSFQGRTEALAALSYAAEHSVIAARELCEVAFEAEPTARIAAIPQATALTVSRWTAGATRDPTVVTTLGKLADLGNQNARRQLLVLDVQPLIDMARDHADPQAIKALHVAATGGNRAAHYALRGFAADGNALALTEISHSLSVAELEQRATTSDTSLRTLNTLAEIGNVAAFDALRRVASGGVEVAEHLLRTMTTTFHERRALRGDVNALAVLESLARHANVDAMDTIARLADAGNQRTARTLRELDVTRVQEHALKGGAVYSVVLCLLASRGNVQAVRVLHRATQMGISIARKMLEDINVEHFARTAALDASSFDTLLLLADARHEGAMAALGNLAAKGHHRAENVLLALVRKSHGRRMAFVTLIKAAEQNPTLCEPLLEVFLHLPSAVQTRWRPMVQRMNLRQLALRAMDDFASAMQLIVFGTEGHPLGLKFAAEKIAELREVAFRDADPEILSMMMSQDVRILIREAERGSVEAGMILSFLAQGGNEGAGKYIRDHAGGCRN